MRGGRHALADVLQAHADGGGKHRDIQQPTDRAEAERHRHAALKGQAVYCRIQPAERELQHDQRIGVRLLLALLHRDDVRREQETAGQRQQIADIQSPGLPIQRQKPDADKHQRRRDQVALLQLLVKQQRAAKRHKQHVDRRQKRILARRRILQADGLHDIRPKERQPDQRAARHVPARQSPQTLMKQRARDRRRNQIAHGDNRPRRKAVQRVFHHRKRAAPNQRRQ